MADISITCPKCGAVTTVSEFVDAAKLKCISCGAQLEKPGGLEQAAKQAAAASKTPTVKHNLRLAKRRREEEGGDDAKSSEGSSLENIIAKPDAEQEDKLGLRPEVKEKKGVNHAILAGLLFLVLGGGMGYLRYGNVLPPNIMQMSADYAWLVVIGINILITLKAMTDSMMQGILCLFIPGYSFYYLFGVTDEFYLRAIVAGLLVGIGQDAAIQLKEHAGQIFGTISHFISSGGGDIR